MRCPDCSGSRMDTETIVVDGDSDGGPQAPTQCLNGATCVSERGPMGASSIMGYTKWDLEQSDSLEGRSLQTRYMTRTGIGDAYKPGNPTPHDGGRDRFRMESNCGGRRQLQMGGGGNNPNNPYGGGYIVIIDAPPPSPPSPPPPPSPPSPPPPPPPAAWH